MKNKKIKFTTVLLMTGLSFASANDNIVSIIENSKIENVRKVGYEFCAFFVKKDKLKKEKGHFQKINNSVFGMEPETVVAMKLNELCMNDEHALEAILSYKPSDNKIIKELQEGWFDFLSEDLLSLASNYVIAILPLGKMDYNLTLDSHSDIHNNETDSSEIEYLEKFPIYNDEQISLFNNINQTAKKRLVATYGFVVTFDFYFELIDALGIDEERSEDLDDKIAHFILNKSKTLTKRRVVK